MAQAISKIISAWPQVAKRSLAHWRLLSSVIIGVLLASTIMAGTVIYFDALRELALENSLSKLTVNETNILVKSDRGPTTVEEYRKVRDATLRQVDARIDWFLRDKIRGGKSSTFFLAEPGAEALAGDDNNRAFFAFLPDRLLDHIEIVEGRLPQEQAIPSSDVPLLFEALIPAEAANEFDLAVGDSLSAVPFWRDAIPFGRIIVSGIFERNDPSNEFWHLNDTVFKASTAISFRTVPFYISEVTYMQVLGATFKKMDSTYGWLLAVDTGKLNADNSTTARLQMSAMRRQLNTTLFSYRQITELDKTLADYDQRLFFSKIPMFVVLVLIAVVILYYVVTLSSLLVDQQRSEVALMRSRGASPAQILIVFVLEGATISVLAIAAGPVLAAAAISFLGFTPAFSGLSGGDSLRVSISSGAYLMSAFGGVLSFVALIIPAVQASRIEVTRHRSEASRPTTEPFFQRFYLDIMLLIVSVILFRQLSEQGSVVAVGLFGDIAVDQILLIVPALILIAFAMVLLRLFPLAIRYLSGDSPALVHLLVYVSVAILAPAILIRGALNGTDFLWIAQVGSLIGIVVAYWVTNRYEKLPIKAAGFAIQALLVVFVILVGPETPLYQIFLPILIGIVPAQILFMLLRGFSHVAPVGFSMGLWQMARNPTHYARLSLLLILMSGLGIFAASFGGTLERSFKERALYSTGADVRLEGLLLNSTGSSRPLEESYLEIPGVEEVSPVIRGFGTDLSKLLGESYKMLSLNGDAVQNIGWFRDDFSRRPMAELLSMLPHSDLPQGVALPENTRSIGVRLKADRAHPTIQVTARILDSNGRYFTYGLGMLTSDDWVELETTLTRVNRFGRRPPLQPQQPVILVAVSVHEVNGRNRLRAGSISIDEIYVKTTSNETVVVEPFADLSRWNLLKVTPQSITDSYGESTIHYNGDSSTALFVWSEGSPLTSRGIFHGAPVTPISVLASKSFLRETGHSLGEEFEVSVRGKRVQIRLEDTIDFFPTLDTFNESYLISDLNSLVRYANLDATSSELRPTEMWMSTNVNGTDRAQLIDTLNSDTPFLHRQVTDRVEVLADSQVDPLVEAGWRALLFIAFSAVLILSCLGFLVHSYVSFSNREVQFALMRTIGFSMRQLTTLVLLEQILVIIAGLALGTWMGGRLGAIIMPFLANNDKGSQVIPPFVLEVNWVTLAITYSAMVFVFALIILGMILFIRRISLQRILRLGEM